MDPVLFTAWGLISFVAVLHLLLFKREPSSTIAWLFFVIFVPILGALVFLIFGPQRLERQAVKRKKEITRRLGSGAFPVHDEVTEGTPLNPWNQLPENEQAVLRLAKRVSAYGVTSGNQIDFMHDPPHALQMMEEAIAKAKHFVHLEYYIIASDDVTRRLFEILDSAAQRGVEVRILYDSLGSFSLKRKFLNKLISHGAKVAGFLPFSPVPQRMNVNFRNHRKILVIDGLVAFTGGTNIGKEYLGRRSRNQWRDYTVRVQGPVCRQLQDVFATDWQFTTAEDLFLPEYYPAGEEIGDSLIQVLESGPDSPFQTLHQAIFLALNAANEEILLTTPYFIPDPPVMTALAVAALRGVRVKLVLPLKSDARLVQLASRSFFDDLLKAGVEIYEYQPRILHAKLLTIDRKWTIVGSANMDIRSFRLNFELNLLVYGKTVADQAVKLFEEDLAESQKVDWETFRRRSVGRQIVENACRLLSPVL